MAKTSGKLPDRFLRLIEPILIKNENIQRVFRESFKWETFFSKWIVLTNFRLLICTRTFFGASSQEFHLREMDVERVKDNFGPYDSLIFKSQDKILYQVAIFRTRRREAEQFLREVTKHIAERDLYTAFPNTGSSESASSFPNTAANSTPDTASKSVEALTPDDLAKCAEKLAHNKDLKEMGVITEKEYKEEKAKPCVRKANKATKRPYVRQKS